MVRTAISIISLLLSVVMSSLVSAQNINVPEAQKIDNYILYVEAQKIDNYILYVQDISLPDSVKIYGQPTFGSDNKYKYYGGDKKDNFIKAYKSANSSSPALEFDRDENGIFFKISVTSDIDSVCITLVQAYLVSNKGWFQKKPEDYISVVCRLKEKADTFNNINAAKEQGDSNPAEQGDGEKVAEIPSSWHISNIDLMLFVFIVVLALAALFGKSKPKEKPGDKAKAAEDPKSEIADLKKQIADLTTASNNCTKAISNLGRLYNTLESDIHKLKEKDRQVNTDNSSKNIQPLRPTPPAKPVNLGGAEPVPGEKALEINSSGVAFFQLTGNVDGQVTFTLIDNPEVRNLFETNPSMLEIYKNDGIISYDSIPNNSHVSVESAGIAKEMRLGKYEVLAPLKLIFK